VFAADDQHVAGEISVGILEIMGDVWEVFAGDAEAARVIGAAGGEDQLVDAGGAFAGARVGGEDESVGGGVGGAIDGDDRLVGADFEIELFYDAAEVGEVLLARGV